MTEHIGANLDRRIDLKELAEIACFSPYHFHRIYRAMMGETVADTATRLRLHRAAGDLVSSERPLMEIARRAGYSSVAAFSRAFRNHYSATPAVFRQRRVGGAGAARAGRALETPVFIEERTPTRLAAMVHIGPYAEIGRTFERLRAWAGPRGLIRPGFLPVGLFHDDPNVTAEEDLRSEAAVMVGPEVDGDEDVRIVELPGGRHAVLVWRGPYGDDDTPYDELFGRWLPESGEEPAASPHFMIFLNDLHTTPPDELLRAVCLPLK
ncbi:MAG: AraC family transcriptional regulator [Caulobacteraceae bacterium]